MTVCPHAHTLWLTLPKSQKVRQHSIKTAHLLHPARLAEPSAPQSLQVAWQQLPPPVAASSRCGTPAPGRAGALAGLQRSEKANKIYRTNLARNNPGWKQNMMLLYHYSSLMRNANAGACSGPSSNMVSQAVRDTQRLISLRIVIYRVLCLNRINRRCKAALEGSLFCTDMSKSTPAVGDAASARSSSSEECRLSRSASSSSCSAC